MAKKLEIEKKYLLGGLPSMKWDHRLYITQYYLPDGSRIRHSCSSHKPVLGIYTMTKKKKLKAGVYEEDEKNISEKTFYSLREKAISSIDKTRYVSKKYGKLKWEIDVYTMGLRLVTAEIELPRENYKFKIPAQIQEQILLDVTEYPQFTNKALSKKIK